MKKIIMMVTQITMGVSAKAQHTNFLKKQGNDTTVHIVTMDSYAENPICIKYGN